jgi:RNA polymerase sigma factor (sigma-70 family)
MSAKKTMTSREEFDRLWAISKRKVFNAALWILRNRDDAEDAVQDTAQRAYAAFERFDTSRSFEAWVLRIVERCCIDFGRRNKRRTAYSLSQPMLLKNGDESTYDIIDEKADVLAYVLSREIGVRFADALKSLPPKYRIAFILIGIHQWSYQELADALGVPVGTIRSRVHRARVALRKELGHIDIHAVK